jgi:hypothetical protein
VIRAFIERRALARSEHIAEARMRAVVQRQKARALWLFGGHELSVFVRLQIAEKYEALADELEATWLMRLWRWLR